MPELPEVENVVRGLRDAVTGRVIERATLTAPDLYRTGSRRISWIRRCRIDSVARVGKSVWFFLVAPDGERNRALVVHLGMTGRFVLPAGDGTGVTLQGEVVRGGAATAISRRMKHRHARLVFDDGSEAWYVDARRFGYFFAGALRGLRETLGIGPDPFEMMPEQLREALRGRTAPIKSALLTPKIVSGIGNIYADEILFRTRLHPLVPAGRATRRAEELLAAARDILGAAIDGGGTTFRDYRKPDGSTGAFQGRLAVYGREGERCPRCDGRIRRIVISARSAHFCPRCQRRPRSLV